MNAGITAPRAPEPPPAKQAAWPLTVAAVLLFSISGFVLVLYVLLDLPLRYSGPFMAFPAALLGMGLILFVRSRHAALQRVARLVLVGTAVGFLATCAYDVARVSIRHVFAFDFDPFWAQRMFGSLMLGVDPDSTAAHVAGWAYHFLNGTNFAVMFALLRPSGGLGWGLLWSLVLEGMMLWVYPSAVEIRPDVGFMTISIGGHAAWGATLGLGVKHWRKVIPG